MRFLYAVPPVLAAVVCVLIGILSITWDLKQHRRGKGGNPVVAIFAGEMIFIATGLLMWAWYNFWRP